MTPDQHIAAAEVLVRDVVDHGSDAPAHVIREAAAHVGMAQTAAQAPAPTYPSAGLDRYYDRGAWNLGEDGDQIMVEGHDRRAYAALNAHLTYYWGLGPHAKQVDIREGHAVIVDECGCTREDHEANHPRPVENFGDNADLYGDVVDGKVLTDCDCDNMGLPPCRDDWAWVAEFSQPGPLALPVLWVSPR